MACSNCNTPNCGCSGTYTVSQTCPPACSEVFNSSCIVYTGVDLTCPDNTTGITSTVISRNDYLDTALTKIIQYFCGRFNSLVIPTTVVESDDPGIVVVEQIVGSVTTYLLSLDPAALPSASIVTGGDNVVVTGDGSAGDPYVVNSHESIVDVTPGTALSVSTSSTGPYENTYTIDIDSSLLPVTELQTSFGHIFITEVPNTPNAGDTTYTLEVDEVTITSIDTKIDIVNTNAGGIAPFERTFTVDVNETEMGNYVMDTAAGILTQGGIIADPGSGITVGYDQLTHTITIGESIGVPFQWQTISDGVTDIIAASANDKLRIVSDAVVDGISVSLASGPGANEATFTIVNEDRGSAQLTFLNVDCSNISGTVGGTCTAGINEDTLNIVGGAEIDVTIPAPNTIQISNTITAVYSNIEGDDSVSLQAGSTTDTLDILGGTGITTSGNAAGPGNNELIITNDALVYSTITGDTGSSPASGIAETLAIVSAGGGCSTTVTADTVTIENTSDIYSRVLGDSGSSSAAGLTDTLTIAGGTGITTNSTGGTVTITADVQSRQVSGVTPPSLVGGDTAAIAHGFATELVQVTVREDGALPQTGYAEGVDYTVSYENNNEVILTDIGGNLVAATSLRVLFIG